MPSLGLGLWACEVLQDGLWHIFIAWMIVVLGLGALSCFVD
jgi:hypothetical protein